MNFHFPFIRNATSFLMAMGSLFLAAPAFGAVGVINNSPSLAWSNQIGWINVNPTNGGVSVEDTRLTGYMWSQNYGWINLAPADGGVINDGQGNLSGKAWGQQTGWIDFSGVTIDPFGNFGGSAAGSIVGSLSFSCTRCQVATSWRPVAVVGPATAGPTPVQKPLTISLNGESDLSRQELRLTLSAPGATQMRLGLTLDTLFKPWQPFVSTTTISFSQSARLTGALTVYAQAQDADGRISPITPFVFSLAQNQEILSPHASSTPLYEAHSLVEHGVLAGISLALNIDCQPYVLTTFSTRSLPAKNEVLKLQYFLLSFLPRGKTSLKMTGKYDSATRQAVQSFQKIFPQDVKVQTPGTVDEETRHKINDLACQAKLHDIFSP